ncbi:MAG: (Na+)-NQR maturation NqrM [Moraxellaceae bacterium]|nr:(Na+)-NQR maturation NqrM [Moraxellaceae bacterium]MDZ4297101.1 (Na+)-NQR maturation NqrM [Moraxellaceae bacterium]MDZ4385833.1 (Na+)-NQR maturation NqrM [Moraxellaceae bacterium]
MALFFVSFFFILLVIVAMAIGVLNGREPIKGSCGGLNRLGLRDGECPVCGDNPAKCDSNDANNTMAVKAAELGKDASR